MKILITGICGFVGSSLAKGLLQRVENIEITGIDNLARAGSESNRLALAQAGIRFVHGDIRMRSDVESLPACDWVIDAAAQPSVLAGVDGKSSPRQLCEHNLGGTLNILEYCRIHKAGFFLLSTSRVYSIEQLAGIPMRVENQAFVPDDAKPLPRGASASGIDATFSTHAPISLYGATKLASEIMALEYGSTFRLPRVDQPLRCFGGRRPVRNCRARNLFLLAARPCRTTRPSGTSASADLAIRCVMRFIRMIWRS